MLKNKILCTILIIILSTYPINGLNHTQITTLAVGSLTAMGIGIWWLFSDKRSDEQVLHDAQYLSDTLTKTYGEYISLFKSQEVTLPDLPDEKILIKLTELGADQQFAKNDVKTLEKNLIALEYRCSKMNNNPLAQHFRELEEHLNLLLSRLKSIQHRVTTNQKYIELYLLRKQIDNIYQSALNKNFIPLVRKVYTTQDSLVMRRWPNVAIMNVLAQDYSSVHQKYQECPAVGDTKLSHLVEDSLKNLEQIYSEIIESELFQNEWAHLNEYSFLYNECKKIKNHVTQRAMLFTVSIPSFEPIVQESMRAYSENVIPNILNRVGQHGPNSSAYQQAMARGQEDLMVCLGKIKWQHDIHINNIQNQQLTRLVHAQNTIINLISSYLHQIGTPAALDLLNDLRSINFIF